MLDAKPINAQLMEDAPPVVCVNQVTSTNSLLRERLAAGDELHILIANEQTKGRGRRGRRWLSPPDGGLYFSYPHVTERPTATLGTLGLVVATSLATAIPAPLRVKWPNDLVLATNGQLAKVGGCLIEMTLNPHPPHIAICGIGINWALKNVIASGAAAPDQAWADLPSTQNKEALVASIVNQLHQDLGLFSAQGFEAFRQRWRALHVLMDQIVQVHESGKDPVVGLAGDVNELGQLAVSTDSGIEWVTAADVSVRPNH